MATFPNTKNDILILAAKVAAGITANPVDYQDPPFDALFLSHLVGEAIDLVAQRQTKQAELDEIVVLENEKIAEVAAKLRTYLDQAEALYKDDPPKLHEIDWDVPSDPKHDKRGRAHARNRPRRVPRRPATHALLAGRGPALDRTKGFRTRRSQDRHETTISQEPNRYRGRTPKTQTHRIRTQSQTTPHHPTRNAQTPNRSQTRNGKHRIQVESTRPPRRRPHPKLRSTTKRQTRPKQTLRPLARFAIRHRYTNIP